LKNSRFCISTVINEIPLQKKSNPKILMSKSDMMLVWEKRCFYYSKNLLCQHHVLLRHSLCFFHIFEHRSDTLRQCQRPRSDNGSDNELTYGLKKIVSEIFEKSWIFYCPLFFFSFLSISGIIFSECMYRKNLLMDTYHIYLFHLPLLL
jgi:hypothetical protein